MQALTRWIAQHPYRVVLFTLLLSLAAFLRCVDLRSWQPRLLIDPSIEHLLPSGNDDREIYDRVKTTFGDNDVVIVAVQFDRVLTADSLARIATLTERYRQLPDVSSVFSLATAPNLLAQGDQLDVSSFTEQAQRDPALIQNFERQLNANPLYKGTLISQDGRIASFALMFNQVSEQDFLQRDYPQQIRNITQEVAADAPVWVTGTAVGRAATTHALIDTIQFTIPAVFAVILLLLLVAFRSFRSMLVAAATVATALLWTMAAASVLHMPMNMVTAIVPPLVITLGLSYSIYLLSSFFAAHAEKDLKTAAERTVWVINRSGIGLILSAGTTVASFMALMPNELPAIKDFAILASIGSVAGVVLALSFMPSLLAIVGGGARSRPVGEVKFAHWAKSLASFDLKWQNWIIAIALLMIPLDLIFATRIHAGSEYIKSFKESAQVRQDFEAINTAFNGANILSILIETHVTDALTDPERVHDIEALQRWLQQQPEVGSVVSYVDHLKLINQSMNNNDPAFYRIPDDAVAIKQLLVFGGGEQIKSAIDTRYQSALLTVRINVDASAPIARLVERIEQRLETLPQPMNAHVTGSSVLATRTVNAIAAGQLESITLATLGIWLLLTLMFTSARAGFIALLPTVVPVAIYFGTLGLLDISLSPTTCLIACIVIGIAVDDTIQFLARFNADAHETASESSAVKSALTAVLRPITLSTVALCLGFLVFTGSELKTQVQFGLLSAFTLFLAWIMNITLTPALSSRLRIVTFWDLLRLDLGQNPQHTIPLFSGLSQRQSRVFALMSKMENVREGERLIQQGDLARDIFVVVDGTLEASVESGNEHKVLSTMGRGAVMGEAGYFGQRRTASIDAVTPARVLRFNSQDLERLRIRYPWIAATIFRNLNRVQAERIARMTSMLK